MGGPRLDSRRPRLSVFRETKSRRRPTKRRSHRHRSLSAPGEAGFSSGRAWILIGGGRRPKRGRRADDVKRPSAKEPDHRGSLDSRRQRSPVPPGRPMADKATERQSIEGVDKERRCSRPIPTCGRLLGWRFSSTVLKRFCVKGLRGAYDAATSRPLALRPVRDARMTTCPRR